jgi:hypothetical protein
VAYYQHRYEVMRRGIVAHPVRVDGSNIDELRAMTFVFLTMDSGPAKKFIVTKLEEFGVLFIDAGMGVYRRGECSTSRRPTAPPYTGACAGAVTRSSHRSARPTGNCSTTATPCR